MSEVVSVPITYHAWCDHDVSGQCYAQLIEDDVEAIRKGKRYPPRGNYEIFMIPQDCSTEIALQVYHIDAYSNSEK